MKYYLLSFESDKQISIERIYNKYPTKLEILGDRLLVSEEEIDQLDPDVIVNNCNKTVEKFRKIN